MTHALLGRLGMRKSSNTIASVAMMAGKEKNVGEFKKPSCNARGAAIA
ncbi:MAG: hypothetical protein RMY34_11675 [Aulosira sp. DedQUE10]|nr:hypothetical protein [Aulosira sp. DedQUE10]